LGIYILPKLKLLQLSFLKFNIGLLVLHYFVRQYNRRSKTHPYGSFLILHITSKACSMRIVRFSWRFMTSYFCQIRLLVVFLILRLGSVRL